MNEKILSTLGYTKILDQLAKYCAFAASKELAHNLRPSIDILEAQQRLLETGEAVSLLTTQPDFSIGGARDIREKVDFANHGGVLDPGDLLDIKYTLVAARNLSRKFDKLTNQFPILTDKVAQLPGPLGIVDAVSKVLSDEGEVLDSASKKLATIRRDIVIVHERLISKLQMMIGDSKKAKYLQETLITQRDGRYVIPLKAEHKGKIKAIVHDQSASGATLFIEPTAIVAMNNQLRELQLAERDEVRRILIVLSEMVGIHAGDISLIVNVVAALDLALAKAKFAEKIEANMPKMFEINLDPSGLKAVDIKLRLYQARHPLLDPKIVVPIDIELDPGTIALVITGPNTGGKTVSLKTVGLLALMAQAGLHIPANSGSELSVFHNIFADIGDEQSIEQSLSTFSGHITNIIHILEEADQKSLVLLDELGAGTDPLEGAALARALLTHIIALRITTLVTTHHPELKTYAHSTPGVMNASVEFDLESLRPTYRLIIGLPGRSNALAIAQRLGLPERIVESARSEINPEELKVDDLLDEIMQQRDLANKARCNAEKLQKEVELLRLELLRRLDAIEDERYKIRKDARAEAEREITELRELIGRTRSQLKRAREPLDMLTVIEDDITELEEDIHQPVERREPAYGVELQEVSAERNKPIQVGDEVIIRTLSAEGVIAEISEDDAEVQVGILRIRTKLSDLAHPIGKSDLDTTKEKGYNSARSNLERRDESKRKSDVSNHTSPGFELDLRGKRADEALDLLDGYLDSAFLEGLPFVRIIHGKGTGKLRSVVREALSTNSHIKSYDGGGEKEGGEGVTIAKLKM